MGVTIKDIAKAAGTSVSTVSKVINGHYSISEETADRVRKVIKELNYAGANVHNDLKYHGALFYPSRRARPVMRSAARKESS